jgi:hypothetical protein
MMSGDEFYDDETTSVLDRADFIRDELKDTIHCGKCGAREPVRLGQDQDGQYGCNECREYLRCFLCRRWTFEEEGAALSRNVDFGARIVAICDTCWERGDEGVTLPLDMTEDDVA